MIHPTAIVESSNIGNNCAIWQFVIILGNAKVGSNCNINCYVFIENDVVIGNNVTVKSGVQIWNGVRIEDDAFIGPNVTFTNDPVPRSKQYPEKFNSTIIGKGASIGANATILSGIRIGDYALIGAGSVLTKSVDSFTVWFGNPAVHRGYITKDGLVLDLNLKDKKGNKFQMINNQIIIND
jgi:UDP-2-acetamido-3-amino-2,3-dideoxy-glucuronate N-acetyltransferase